MNPTASSIDTSATPPLSKPSRTGSQKLYVKLNQQRPKHMSQRFAQSITRTTIAQMPSMTHVSNVSSMVQGVHMEKESAGLAFHSQPTFYSTSLDTSQRRLMAITSEHH